MDNFNAITAGPEGAFLVAVVGAEIEKNHFTIEMP